MKLKERILILGGSGFVGRELTNYFDSPGTSLSGKEGFIRCDTTNLFSLEKTIESVRPEIIVNCVGLADVDRAETDLALANELNIQTVANITEMQKRYGFRLVHISTDYVFDGIKGNYAENDETHPINNYGLTKLAGEYVASRDPVNLVVRISTPYGKERGGTKKQFFRYVVESLKERKQVRALCDQFVTSTYLTDLARALDELCEKGCTGIYHITGEERLSRYEFACMIAEAADLDRALIVKASVTEMTAWKAKRPLDTSLLVSKSKVEGVKYTSPRQALKELF